MKQLLTYALISVLVLTAANVHAQTTVTGHVFAEVVESVSASSNSQNSFTIQRSQTTGIDLGQIEIKSAASASCSLILGKVNLTGNNMNRVSMETSATSNLGMQGNAINGYQSISLKCQPDAGMLAQDASEYKGNINIVLAYN